MCIWGLGQRSRFERHQDIDDNRNTGIDENFQAKCTVRKSRLKTGPAEWPTLQGMVKSKHSEKETEKGQWGRRGESQDREASQNPRGLGMLFGQVAMPGLAERDLSAIDPETSSRRTTGRAGRCQAAEQQRLSGKEESGSWRTFS